MRILVTNDDGIDSIGLHLLALSLADLGDVVVAAPDQEYSGAGAAIGALHLIRPEVHRMSISSLQQIPEVWSVSGPPALCVMFARLGVFGPPPDLVVSGINPGANVGRAIYHSGTVGAALTARNGGINAIAVSQDVADGSFDGQISMEESLSRQLWSSAAEVARVVTIALMTDLPTVAVALNVNVPNCTISEMRGWRHTEVGMVPPRTLGSASLEPKPGHDNAFRVTMNWGQETELPETTDGGAVSAGYVSICELSRMVAHPEPTSVRSALSQLFPQQPNAVS